MPIRALPLFTPAWYEPPGQTDEPKTRFLLQGLDGAQQSIVGPGIIVRDDDSIQFTPATSTAFFRFGVLDWENLVDENGNQVPHPDDPLKAQKLVPYTLQVKIFSELFRLSFLNLEDKKKS